MKNVLPLFRSLIMFIPSNSKIKILKKKIILDSTCLPSFQVRIFFCVSLCKKFIKGHIILVCNYFIAFMENEAKALNNDALLTYRRMITKLSRKYIDNKMLSSHNIVDLIHVYIWSTYT